MRPPNQHVPPLPPTIPGGALNPDPVRDPPPLHPIPRAPGAAAPPDAVRPAHPVQPPPPPGGRGGVNPPPLPPGAYDPTDPQLFWMNNRPFLIHRSVGKGGFGEVYEAEMMLPPGMEVIRNPRYGVTFSIRHQTSKPCMHQHLPHTHCMLTL